MLERGNIQTRCLLSFEKIKSTFLGLASRDLIAWISDISGLIKYLPDRFFSLGRVDIILLKAQFLIFQMSSGICQPVVRSLAKVARETVTR